MNYIWNRNFYFYFIIISFFILTLNIFKCNLLACVARNIIFSNFIKFTRSTMLYMFSCSNICNKWKLQDAIQYFHSFIPDVSEQLCRQHPSKLVCAILPSITDHSVCKRLITCVLAALRANGMCEFFNKTQIK